MCQERRSPSRTVRWPVISIPLSGGPGGVISLDYFGPLRTTSNGNKYMLLVMGPFNRHAVSSLHLLLIFSALGTANILVNDHFPK